MDVAQGIQRYVDQDVVNWYLVETSEGPVAVDAGFPTAWKQIQERAGELRAILITHAHIDHLGFAELARRTHGTPVYVPEGDAKLARHTLKYAKSERLPLAYLKYGPTRRLYWKATKSGSIVGKTLSEFTTYADGEQLPGGFRAVFTPGHTKGHMCLHLPERDVLFAGDAIVTVDPYTDRVGPRLVARAATWDSARAKASLDAIEQTQAKTLLTGHGDPWTQGAETAAAQARANGAA
jgi:glyoxylase-like metal-dependent hydrolase (beta-lactamase superfamily II)